MVLRLLTHAMLSDFCLDCAKAGKSIAVRIAATADTAKRSARVKATSFCLSGNFILRKKLAQDSDLSTSPKAKQARRRHALRNPNQNPDAKYQRAAQNNLQHGG